MKLSDVVLSFFCLIWLSLKITWNVFVSDCKSGRFIAAGGDVSTSEGELWLLQLGLSRAESLNQHSRRLLVLHTTHGEKHTHTHPSASFFWSSSSFCSRGAVCPANVTVSLPLPLLTPLVSFRAPYITMRSRGAASARSHRQTLLLFQAKTAATRWNVSAWHTRRSTRLLMKTYVQNKWRETFSHLFYFKVEIDKEADPSVESPVGVASIKWISDILFSPSS